MGTRRAISATSSTQTIRSSAGTSATSAIALPLRSPGLSHSSTVRNSGRHGRTPDLLKRSWATSSTPATQQSPRSSGARSSRLQRSDFGYTSGWTRRTSSHRSRRALTDRRYLFPQSGPTRATTVAGALLRSREIMEPIPTIDIRIVLFIRC